MPDCANKTYYITKYMYIQIRTLIHIINIVHDLELNIP